MNRLCILDSRNNQCINILFLEDESEWKDHAYFIKSPRNDGEVGWTLLQNGEWQTNEPELTYGELCWRVRSRRDKYLQLSDKYMLLDYPITEQKRQEWADYRQQLRDLTGQTGYPTDVIWPTMPTE
jgi:hypothetical protein